MLNNMDIKTSIRNSAKTYKKNGALDLLHEISGKVYIKSLREILPTEKQVYDFKSGNYVPVKKFDQYTPKKYKPYDNNEKRVYRNFHQEVTKEGDEVVIVGGGYGISAYYASQAVGKDGKVTVYEASDSQVDILNEMMDKRKIGNICSIIHGLVGEEINVYGDSNNHQTVSVDNLPECDVLELDCEGAELKIIDDLEILPRDIVCEIHAQYIDNPEAVVERIRELGYVIKAFTSNTTKELQFESEHKIYNNVSSSNRSSVIWAQLK